MSLVKYRQKRHFDKTPEPKGKKATFVNEKNLYLIQKHAASHLHYDLRLELNGVLMSWAIPKGPSLDPAVKRLAVQVEDHPLEYGYFEGSIPKGQYGGGTVMIWDTGKWISLDPNPTKAYYSGKMSFILRGKKLKGSWKLFRSSKDNKNWFLIKIKDKYSKSLSDYDITLKKIKSAITNKSMEQIEKSNHVWHSHKSKRNNFIEILNKYSLKNQTFPNKISPQLATLVNAPPRGKGWIHEIKLDGYRILTFIKNGKIKLLTRNHKDWTNKFKSIVSSLNIYKKKDMILDGEIIVYDKNGKSNFQLMQNSLKFGDNNQFVYRIFDIVYYDKYELTQIPLIDRKTILRAILKDNDTIHYHEFFTNSGAKILYEACKLGLEGIISKNLHSLYIQKRTTNWLKSKCLKRQEFIIGGYLKSSGKRKYFKSLLLGSYNKKHELIYHGNVGTGFTEASLEQVYKILFRKVTDNKPFKQKIPNESQTVWIDPVIICEVEFTEWTEDGFLRHPSFQGLRQDKSPKEITVEVEKSTKNLDITNSNKILYHNEKITKQEIAEYYNSVTNWILPHIKERALALVRCPDTSKKCFFQKNYKNGMPRGVKKNKQKLIYINDLEGLIGLVQLGCLEIHTWNSNINKIEYPDMLVFDLDPAPNVKWSVVVFAAHQIRNYLNKIHLQSFVKSTGGKGLHIVVPIIPEYDWKQIKNFCKTFVDYIVTQNPDHYTNKMTKSSRSGKIFIDYLRNQRGSTSIAPYSTRARDEAPVSVPLNWKELTDRYLDTFFTVKSLPLRLKKLNKDPWEGFFTIKQHLI